jgi:hypothetical protein
LRLEEADRLLQLDESINYVVGANSIHLLPALVGRKKNSFNTELSGPENVPIHIVADEKHVLGHNLQFI